MERIRWTILLMSCAFKFIVDRIVWISIIVFACAAIGFVLHRCWKKWKSLNQVQVNPESEWTKLRRGESMRSFRMWLDCEYCRDRPLNTCCHSIVRLPLPISGDSDRWNVGGSAMRILTTIDRGIPNAAIGARQLTLRRYSLVSSNVYSDILRIRYIRGPAPWFAMPTWRFQSASLVGRGIVDIVFKCQQHLQETVVLVDTHRRTYAQISLVAPTGMRWAIRTYRAEEEMNRLLILYGIVNAHGFAVRFVVVEHVIELVRHPSKLHARRMRTVITPIAGNLKPGNIYGLSLRGTCVLKGNALANSKVITFDRRFNATIRPLDGFLQELHASPIGQRALAAVHDFVAMLPPEAEQRLVFCFVYGSHIVGKIGDVYVRRLMRPPSPSFQAAETICRLRPNADDLATLENEIGVDVFDGIFEEKKKPAMIMMSIRW